MQLAADLVNFALALVFWATLGRILLDRITGGRDNFFAGVLRKPTEPFYALAARVVPRAWVPIAVLALVIALRISLLPLLRPPQ